MKFSLLQSATTIALSAVLNSIVIEAGCNKVPCSAPAARRKLAGKDNSNGNSKAKGRGPLAFIDPISTCRQRFDEGREVCCDDFADDDPNKCCCGQPAARRLVEGLLNWGDMDTIPSECLDDAYDVSLHATANSDNLHFTLVGTNQNEDNNDNDHYCPPTIVMDQDSGEKIVALLLKVKDDLDMLFPSSAAHHLGKATLGDIIKAEEQVDAIGLSEYNYFYNSCAHYAQRIWRSLGVEETKELADFFVDHIIIDKGGSNGGLEFNERGVRALAAVAVGKDGLRGYVEDIVYSQLNFV